MHKRKEQLKNRIVNRIIFKEKIKDEGIIRALNITPFEDLMLQYFRLMDKPATLKECHNQFVLIKKFSDYAKKQRGKAKRELNEYKLEVNKFIKKHKLENLYLDEIEENKREYIENMKKIIECCQTVQRIYEDTIILMNLRLDQICSFYDEYNLNFNDFCSLVGINTKIAKKNIEDVEGEGYYAYLFDGIEDSRIFKDFKHNPNGMPLFDLTIKAMLIHMDRNKDLKQKTDDMLFELMPELRGNMLTQKINDDGEVVLEKYYPPLQLVK